jgi:hypothetical protein
MKTFENEKYDDYDKLLKKFHELFITERREFYIMMTDTQKENFDNEIVKIIQKLNSNNL